MAALQREEVPQYLGCMIECSDRVQCWNAMIDWSRIIGWTELQKLITTMDIFDFPDDYKPEKPLTDQEAQDITNYLKSHPLFMKEIPDDISQNQHLVALQQIIADEDPTETAESLNKQANARLKQSPNGVYHLKDAYAKYSEAINLKCPSAATNAKLHANRAQLNLKLRNYGKVIKDCKTCLQYDPNYVKGYYRYAKALMGLEKYSQCVKLLQSQTSQELQELRLESQHKLDCQQQKQKQKTAHNQTNKMSIENYCMERGYKLMKREEPLPEGAQLKLIGLKLSIPLMIIYPEFKQFDLAASSMQSHKIRDHVAEMMGQGLPWDSKKEYNMNSIELFCEVSDAILMKIPLQAKIGQIASRIVLKQALQLYVLKRDNEFYKFFTSQYKLI